jgi:REP element-mobilizing transposase RayT
MAKGRMKYPPTKLTTVMIEAVASALGVCVHDSDWQVLEAAMESTHMHLLLSYTERDIDNTAKWIAQMTTKSVHKTTTFTGPVWCEGIWLEFIYDQQHWDNLRRYIERHNIRRNIPAKPWDWIS